MIEAVRSRNAVPVGSLLRALGGALVVALVSAPVQAATITFSTPLAPEVAGATGSGSATVIYDDVAQSLAITTSFTGLSGLTTVAHIHCCTAVPFAGTVGVAVTPGTLPGFPTNVSAGTYDIVLDLTQSTTYTGGFLTAGGGTAAGAESLLVAGMLDGRAYLNIHTTPNFLGGEIRGFLQPVPEPATLLLLGAAAACGAIRRRRVQA